ncbi:MAG: PAS domain-containing protein [Deltaproteobacteria bacterium]|nr:PAS domain-containing protein [Deltaproteobacteria bacterium]
MVNYDEKLLSRVFDSVTDSLAIYDREFRVLRINQALTQLFGLPTQEIIGNYCYKVFYDRTQICDECHVKEVFRTSEKQMLEKYVTIADGSKRIFEVHSFPIKDFKGKTIQAVEHFRDISKRKKFENQLEASKKFNEKVVNSITDNLTIIDPDTYRIIQANEPFYSRIGIKPVDVIGNKCHVVMSGRLTPCDEVGGQCAVQKTIHSKQPFISDKIYPNSSGKPQVLQVATYPIFDNQGEISSIIRLERDVTEKRKMADDLAFRTKELQGTQHQLERLFKISRQVNAKNTISEIVDYAHEVTQKIFPDAVPLIFLLDARGQNLLSLEGCNPTVLEPILRVQQEIEKLELVSNFIQYLQNTREPRVVGSTYNTDIPDFLRIILRDCPSWFGFPISAPQQSIGYFVLSSQDAHEFSYGEINFFLTLFNQIAGHIRHLVTYETEINDLRQRVVERTSHEKIIGQSDEMQTRATRCRRYMN